MFNFKTRIYIALIGSIFLFSCAAPQRTVYFRTNDALDSNVQTIAGNQDFESIIQPDDILAINITSISSITDNSLVAILKEGGTPYSITAGASTASSAGNAGYLVDKQGFIDFPVLGKINVQGKTIREAKNIIAQKLNTSIKDPVVEVRIINYKVVVLGEVMRPGTILAPNHKINIIEAIAAAGDIPISGKKDNVLIVRENGSKREFARLNLNSRDVFQSPYYYLKQNDIVYVEAAKVKKQESSPFIRVYLPIISTLVSTGLSVYAVILSSSR